jgi:prefoldin subunit 5
MEDIQSSLSEIATEIRAIQSGIEALELEIKNISKAIDECASLGFFGRTW